MSMLHYVCFYAGATIAVAATVYLIGYCIVQLVAFVRTPPKFRKVIDNTDSVAIEDLLGLAKEAQEYLHVFAGGDARAWGLKEVRPAMLEASERLKPENIVIVVSHSPLEGEGHPLAELARENLITLLVSRDDDIPHPQPHFRLADGRHWSIEGLHPSGEQARRFKSARNASLAGADLERQFRSIVSRSHRYSRT